MRIAYFFPVLIALAAASGCGACVNSGDANGGSASSGNATSPPTQASGAGGGGGTGGGKMIHRVTTVPAAVRLMQSATLNDGG